MAAIAGIFHAGTPKPVDPVRIGAMVRAQTGHRDDEGARSWTALVEVARDAGAVGLDVLVDAGRLGHRWEPVPLIEAVTGIGPTANGPNLRTI